MFCVKCGTPIDEQTGLCPNCDMPKPLEQPNYGMQIQYEQSIYGMQMPPEQPPKKPKNKKKGKIIAISVISVVLCVAIVFTTLFGLGFFKKDEPVEVKTEEKEKEKIPEIYGKISEQYAKAMLKKDSSVNGEYVNKNLLSKFKDNEKYKVFFSLVDINKDGTEELIIGGGEDKNSTKIYDIFTNDGERPVALFPKDSIGDNKSLDVYDNGNIKMTDNKTPTLQKFDYYTLPEDSTSVTHEMGLTEDDGKYYKHDENGNYISTLTKEEYDSVVDSFESAKIKTEWTELVPEDYATETKEITFEEARIIAETYWNLTASSDGYYYEGDNQLAIFGDESEAVELNGVKYYYFRLRAYVEDHWTTWDMIYVNSQTGECSLRLPDNQDADVLTEEQLESFDALINADFDLWGNKVEGNTINEYYVNNYIYNSFFASEKMTMYNYYFPDQVQKAYSDPLNKFNDTYSQNMCCYVYDADKVLFILNDVFGLNVTTDEATTYYYFKDGKFYYAEQYDGAGWSYYSEREITSYEKQPDGYYLIKIMHYDKEYDTNSIVGVSEMEFVTKPCTHPQYGDYWEIKSMKSRDVTDEFLS